MTNKIWVAYALVAALVGFKVVSPIVGTGLALASAAVLLAEGLQAHFTHTQALDKMLHEHLNEINVHMENLYDLIHTWRAEERERKNALIGK